MSIFLHFPCPRCPLLTFGWIFIECLLWAAQKKNEMPLNLFYFGHFVLTITVNILRLPELLSVSICARVYVDACVCVYVCVLCAHFSINSRASKIN